MVSSSDRPCSGRDLALDRLPERHFGITVEIGGSYAQAAAVCLSRHHVPPAAVQISVDGVDTDLHRVNWLVPDTRIRAAWANDEDATRDGAYGMVLAAADTHLGLVTLGRTPVGSGAD